MIQARVVRAPNSQSAVTSHLIVSLYRVVANIAAPDKHPCHSFDEPFGTRRNICDWGSSLGRSARAGHRAVSRRKRSRCRIDLGAPSWPRRPAPPTSADVAPLKFGLSGPPFIMEPLWPWGAKVWPYPEDQSFMSEIRTSVGSSVRRSGETHRFSGGVDHGVLVRPP